MGDQAPNTRPRVAVVSLHTSPLDQPGTGDSGGMNVYIRAAADRLAARGLDVDVFTRCRGEDLREVEDLDGGARLVRVKAGPCAPVPKEDLPRYLPEFLGGMLRRERTEGRPYDLVHSHYWLSGWVGRGAKELWGIPLVASFHTLGKVKNYSLARDEPSEPSVRLAGEHAVIAEADRIMAATPAEASQLVGLYAADPDRVRLAPPGVDHRVFRPRSRERSKERLHLTRVRLVLFVGRLQAHKAPDVAVRTLAEASSRAPAGDELVLGVVGGPSGDGHAGEMARLAHLASALGVADRVMFFPPQPQRRLAEFYAAADALLVPSRSESFGLVALEAQACGTPVIAAAVGGLRYSVVNGVTGFLVDGHDPADHAERLLALLHDPRRATDMSRAAVRHSMRFSWDATAGEIDAVYRELLPQRRPDPIAA